MDQELDRWICQKVGIKYRILDIIDLVKIYGKLLGYDIKTKREYRQGSCVNNVYYLYKSTQRYCYAYFMREDRHQFILLYTLPHKRRIYYHDEICRGRKSLYAQIIHHILYTTN